MRPCAKRAPIVWALPASSPSLAGRVTPPGTITAGSVRHAASNELILEVSVSHETIHVCVTDGGPGFEVAPRAPDDDPGSGWGLFLVEQLSDRWGVELNGPTQVWFEIER